MTLLVLCKHFRISFGANNHEIAEPKINTYTKKMQILAVLEELCLTTWRTVQLYVIQCWQCKWMTTFFCHTEDSFHNLIKLSLVFLYLQQTCKQSSLSVNETSEGPNLFINKPQAVWEAKCHFYLFSCESFISVIIGSVPVHDMKNCSQQFTEKHGWGERHILAYEYVSSPNK